jgi:transposase
MEKMYCGIDIHKEKLAGCIIDKNGKTIREHNFPFSKEAIERFLYDIPNSEITIAIETCAMWRGVYKILTEKGYNVKLTDPKKTHDIACRKKTDKVDAKILADLLRTKYIPEVWIPDEQTIRLRDLTRHKSNLTRLRVQTQVKIKSYLLRKGTKYSKHLWKEKPLKMLAENDPDIKNLVKVYQCLINEEKEVMNRIGKTARGIKEAGLLMSMTGIGEFSSLVILAEIGDIKRFSSPKALVSYSGLCPGIYQSGSTERCVRNNSVNKWLKWILYECSGRATMLDPKFQKCYFKVKQRKGFKTARRAAARKMITIIWYMLTNEEPYRAS